MPGPLKHILHERFALMYPGLAAKGLGLGEIYAAAGGQASTKRAREVMGSRIFARPDVKDRISELAKPAAAKAARDAEHYLGRLDQVFTGSIEDREFGHAARATELGARISGVLIDRAEVSVAFTELSSVDDVLDSFVADADIGQGDPGKAAAYLHDLADQILARAAARARPVNGAVMNGAPVIETGAAEAKDQATSE